VKEPVGMASIVIGSWPVSLYVNGLRLGWPMNVVVPTWAKAAATQYVPGSEMGGAVDGSSIVRRVVGPNVKFGGSSSEANQGLSEADQVQLASMVQMTPSAVMMSAVMMAA